MSCWQVLLVGGKRQLGLVRHVDDLSRIERDAISAQDPGDSARGHKHVVNLDAAHQSHSHAMNAHTEFGQRAHANSYCIWQLVRHREIFT